MMAAPSSDASQQPPRPAARPEAAYFSSAHDGKTLPLVELPAALVELVLAGGMDPQGEG
jgi:hypothetical protein